MGLDAQSPLQTLVSRKPQESPQGLACRADMKACRTGSHRAVPAPLFWPTGQQATEVRAVGSLLCVLTVKQHGRNVCTTTAVKIREG